MLLCNTDSGKVCLQYLQIQLTPSTYRVRVISCLLKCSARRNFRPQRWQTNLRVLLFGSLLWLTLFVLSPCWSVFGSDGLGGVWPSWWWGEIVGGEVPSRIRLFACRTWLTGAGNIAMSYKSKSLFLVLLVNILSTPATTKRRADRTLLSSLRLTFAVTFKVVFE